MPSAKEDQNIHISGGTINAGALAVGTGARAVQTATSGSPPEVAGVQRMLDEVLVLLRSQSPRGGGHQGIVDAVTTVKEELKKEQPSRLTVSAVLDGILKTVQSTASLATAVQAAKVAVEALLR